MSLAQGRERGCPGMRRAPAWVLTGGQVSRSAWGSHVDAPLSRATHGAEPQEQRERVAGEVRARTQDQAVPRAGGAALSSDTRSAGWVQSGGCSSDVLMN